MGGGGRDAKDSTMLHESWIPFHGISQHSERKHESMDGCDSIRITADLSTQSMYIRITKQNGRQLQALGFSNR